MINYEKIKRVIVRLLVYIIICMLAEIFVFNYKFFVSQGDENEIAAFHAGGGYEFTEDNYLVEKKDAYIEVDDIDSEIKYMYIDLKYMDETVKNPITNIKVQISDEGNAYLYTAGERTICDTIESSKYIRIHSYGKVKSIRIYIEHEKDENIAVEKLVFNANVPFKIRTDRVINIFIMLCIAGAFMPGSCIYGIKLYSEQFSMREFGIKLMSFAAGICICAISFYCMVWLAGVYNNPPWQHHHQYNLLAESLMEGRTDITVTGDDVSGLSNPYDTVLRRYEAPAAPWDIAYYEGKYYVYFGIVPELIFYLPYYAITGNHFSTWTGIFICALAVLAGTYVMLAQLVKYRFKNVSFGIYFLLSHIFVTGVGVIPILFRPDFYSLPIIMALAFTVSGLAFWFNAAYKLEHGKAAGIQLFAGAVCMAMVCGCRPQFLVGSVLFIPIFWNSMIKSHCTGIREIKCIFNRENIKRIAITAVPYIIIFSGIMYYNYIRFGSPFDFGANYNLTTNDMNYRGFNAGRLKDAVFMYMFQPPLISQVFPYIQNTTFSSDYVGKIIYESMYGGALFVNPVTWFHLYGVKTKKSFSNKSVWVISVLCLFFAFVVCIMDAQMAGILSRYYYDFFWLLLLGSVICVMNICNNRGGKTENTLFMRRITTVVLVAGAAGLIFNLAIGLHQSEIINFYPQYYYTIKHYLS